MPLLFSYGTLQDERVQLDLFGRRLVGQRDELLGYEQTLVRVADPDFARTSGKAEHAMLRPASNARAVVAGTAFEVTDDELERADRYEPAEYRRLLAALASGRPAWVYVDASRVPEPSRLVCRRARAEDFAALAQMLELYQYELSDIWPQDLDAQGRYGYDLTHHRRGERFHAHLALDGDRYIGFALVAPAVVTRKGGSWMEQFFVLKRHRRTGAGAALARHVLRSHPGPWEVGQMPANAVAQAFWRRVIGDVTGGEFVEVRVTEGWWQGVVQQFDIGPGKGTVA